MNLLLFIALCVSPGDFRGEQIVSPVNQYTSNLTKEEIEAILAEEEQTSEVKPDVDQQEDPAENQQEGLQTSDKKDSDNNDDSPQEPKPLKTKKTGDIVTDAVNEALDSIGDLGF